MADNSHLSVYLQEALDGMNPKQVQHFRKELHKEVIQTIKKTAEEIKGKSDEKYPNDEK